MSDLHDHPPFITIESGDRAGSSSSSSSASSSSGDEDAQRTLANEQVDDNAGTGAETKESKQENSSNEGADDQTDTETTLEAYKRQLLVRKVSLTRLHRAIVTAACIRWSSYRAEMVYRPCLWTPG